MTLARVVEPRAFGVVVADGVVFRAVGVLHQAFDEGNAGVPVRVAGYVAGDVGGEGWVLGTLGGRGGRVGGGGGDGGDGTVVEADWGF